ncbi:hypothetical protein MBRA1_002710 [Malassezia brasiliensis]|uniref:Uncharacterized protein n=1 Tax=Malassezia brasiliensis TaxID=1821822 RepID=A0AAF0DXZ7_9BASI|nr:hypothetical protein MBRA1_002710 [Malassezia brasiliensis]
MAGADGEPDDRLWSLILDLSAQVTANKQVADALKTQIDELQGQAVHAKTGYALRRFNVDVAEETFTSELERLNVQLTQENTMLAHEAKQLGALLRECEATLETVMGKFRRFSHAVQQYGLDLSAYYQSRLAAQTAQLDALQRHEHQDRDASMARLGALVRDALRLVDGEDAAADGTGRASDAALDTATEVEQLRVENAMLRSLLGLPQAQDGGEAGAASAASTASAATDVPAQAIEVRTAVPPVAPDAAALDTSDTGHVAPPV